MSACAEMPGRWDFGPDPQQQDDRALIAWAEEHGCEPEQCVRCGALVEAVDQRRRCEGCAEDLASRRKADLPVSAEDFSNPCPDADLSAEGGPPF